jgi:hypothetical protein
VAYDKSELFVNDEVKSTVTLRNNEAVRQNMVLVTIGIAPGFTVNTNDLRKNLEGTLQIRNGRPPARSVHHRARSERHANLRVLTSGHHTQHRRRRRRRGPHVPRAGKKTRAAAQPMKVAVR